MVEPSNIDLKTKELAGYGTCCMCRKLLDDAEADFCKDCFWRFLALTVYSGGAFQELKRLKATFREDHPDTE